MIYKANARDDEFFEAVYKVTGFTKGQLVDKNRTEPLASVRAICLVLLYERYRTASDAARIMGRHRTLVHYVRDQHKERISLEDHQQGVQIFKDKNYYDTYTAIKEELNN